MNRRIQLTLASEEDLLGIWQYIAIENHSPNAADQLIDEIDQRLNLLVQFADLGEEVPHLRPATRRVVLRKRFLLFYEPTAEGILVLRVLHGAMLIRPDDLNANRGIR